jgi:hypothetical protein
MRPPAAAPPSAPMPAPFSRVVKAPPEQPADVSMTAAKKTVIVRFIAPLLLMLGWKICDDAIVAKRPYGDKHEIRFPLLIPAT